MENKIDSIGLIDYLINNFIDIKKTNDISQMYLNSFQHLSEERLSNLRKISHNASFSEENFFTFQDKSNIYCEINFDYLPIEKDLVKQLQRTKECKAQGKNWKDEDDEKLANCKIQFLSNNLFTNIKLYFRYYSIKRYLNKQYDKTSQASLTNDVYKLYEGMNVKLFKDLKAWTVQDGDKILLITLLSLNKTVAANSFYISIEQIRYRNN